MLVSFVVVSRGSDSVSRVEGEVAGAEDARAERERRSIGSQRMVELICILG